MELIELVVLIYAALFGDKKKQERLNQKRQHRIEPGTDLEGARPKIDRYGLDHAVPVLMYEMGPDTVVQSARKRAGEKRRQIELRLAAEEERREEADSREQRAHTAALTGDAPAADRDAYAIDGEAGEQPTRYPYAFQQEAKVVRRGQTMPHYKAALVASTEPIAHRVSAGGQVARRQRQRDSSLGVIKLLTTPKSLAQVVKAKVILDPPPALADDLKHFRT